MRNELMILRRKHAVALRDLATTRTTLATIRSGPKRVRKEFEELRNLR